ncbi:hypothetical protein ACA910_019452 [Epithemia clementina (nom. ined.)]
MKLFYSFRILPLLALPLWVQGDSPSLRASLNKDTSRSETKGQRELELFANPDASGSTASDDKDDTGSLVQSSVVGRENPGTYLVEFDDADADPVGHAFELTKLLKKDPDYVFEASLKGFVVSGINASQAGDLALMQGVRRVTPDQEYKVEPIMFELDEGSYSFSEREQALASSNNSTRKLNAAEMLKVYKVPQEPSWGTTLIAGGALPPKYRGRNVAWVIDSGISDHPDLNIDRSKGFSYFDTVKGHGRTKGALDDLAGHGTHVAGIIAAKANKYGTVGVAPGAKVVSVKVLNEENIGTLAGIIAGIDHVAKYGREGDVCNMSLGGPYSPEVNEAVKRAAAKGIKFCLAAGNFALDAAYFSPPSTNAENVYTISATSKNNRHTSWSNFGATTVDYGCPGSRIVSTFLYNGYMELTGTSMAAPHFCGALLQETSGKATIGVQAYAEDDPDGNPDPIPILKFGQQ